MLVLIESQIAFALGFARTKESVSRGELGHQQAAGAFFENRRGLLLATSEFCT